MIKRRISNAKNKSDIPASSTAHNLIFPVDMATSWGKLLWLLWEHDMMMMLRESKKNTTLIDYDTHAVVHTRHEDAHHMGRQFKVGPSVHPPKKSDHASN